MSHTPEQKIYDQLVRSLMRVVGKGCYRLVRIESSTGEGIPDIYCRLSRDSTCWIETKSDQYKLSKEQWAWCVRERQFGGEVWMFVTGGVFIRMDGEMLKYSSLGAYRRAVCHVELSVEAWYDYCTRTA